MDIKKPNLDSPLSKALYVAGVTTFCTFLACWAVLAHQGTNQSTRSSVTASDELFAQTAAQGGLAEVELGRLAQQNGANAAVKVFGQRMVQDHTRANEELKKAAKKDGVALPTDLNEKDQAAIDEMSKLSGPAFDAAYARDMVKDQWDKIAEFHREASGGQKGAIKKFAADSLPTLDDHLKQARDMRQIVADAAAAPALTPVKIPVKAKSSRHSSSK